MYNSVKYRTHSIYYNTTSLYINLPSKRTDCNSVCGFMRNFTDFLKLFAFENGGVVVSIYLLIFFGIYA